MIGPHVIQTTTAAMDWARRAPIVKALDNVDVLKAAPDEATRIHRHYWPVQSFSDDPQRTANELIASLGGYRHPKLYVEIFNEYWERWDSVAGFLAAVTNHLHAAGVKVAGPCWGTGSYEQADWDWARMHAWFGFDAIALHAYWADAGFTVWNSLRWRQFWQPGDPDVYVTECGRDFVRDGAGGMMIGKGGWKADGLSAEQYAAEVNAYGVEVGRYGYEKGSVVFTAGATHDWANYDADPVAALVQGGTVPATQSTGGTMPDQTTPALTEAQQDQVIQMIARQNSYLTEALKRIRQGKWDGADGVDGLIVALQGGKPLDFTPSYPPKA